MSTEVSSADARAKFAELLGRAEDHHERFVITVHGKPTAVLVSLYEFESMQETLDILSDPATMARLADSDRDIEMGNIVADDTAPGTVAHQAA